MDRQLFALRGVNFWYFGANSLIAAYFPLYFAKMGFTSTQIGLMMSIGPFAAIFVQPFWGVVSDRLQSIKPIVILLWTLSFASSVGLFMTNGYIGAMSFILLLQFFMLPSSPLLDSILLKAAVKRGSSYGKLRLWGSLGFALTAIASGFIMQTIGGIEKLPWFYWIFWIFPFLFVFLMRDEQATGGERVTLGQMKLILGNKQFLWFLFVVFLLMIPHRMNDALFAVYMTGIGGSGQMVSWGWAAAAICEVPIFMLFGKIVACYQETALLSIVSILFAVRWMMFMYITDPWLVLLVQPVHALTFGVFWITAVHYVARLLPDQFTTTGQSLLAMVFLGICGIVGGTVGGWLYEQGGQSFMYGFGVIMSLVAAILFVITRLRAGKSGVRMNDI